MTVRKSAAARKLITMWAIAALYLWTCQVARAQTSSNPEADFHAKIIAVRTACSSSEPLRSTELCQAMAAVDGYLARAIDSSSNESVNNIVRISLTKYLGSPSDLDVLKDKLEKLSAALNKGDLSPLPDLYLIPQQFCTDLNVPANFCRAPSCFSSAQKSEQMRECPPIQQLSITKEQLARQANDWIGKHQASFRPCSGDTEACLPIDRDVVTARALLTGNGLGLVASLSSWIETAPTALVDPANINKLVSSELDCITDRAEAIELSTRIPSDLMSQSLAPFIGAGVNPSEILASLQRSRQLACRGMATDNLFTAVAKLLDDSQKQLAAPLLVPATEGMGSSASKTTDKTSERMESTPARLSIDLPIDGSDFVRGLRVRLDRQLPVPGTGVTARISLLLDDSGLGRARQGDQPQPLKTKPSLPCCEGSREIDLNIRVSNLVVTGDQVRISGPLGVDTYSTDESRLAHAIQAISSVPLLSFRASKILLSQNILPLSFDVKCLLPGLNSSIDMGTMTLGADGISDTLKQLLDRRTLLGQIDQALRKLGPISLRTAKLGDFRLEKLSIHVDDGGGNKLKYNAEFHNSLVDSLTEGTGIQTVVSVSEDGTFSTDATVPSAKMLAKLNDQVEKAAESFLPEALKAKLLAQDSWVHIDGPVLVDGVVSFTVVLSPQGVEALDGIRINLQSSLGDITPQITQQLAKEANKIAGTLRAYAETTLKNEGERWLANQALYNEAALRAALKQDVSLFGMQLKVIAITSESDRLSITVKSYGPDQPLFQVSGIRIGELDREGRPVISGISLEHALIEGDFTSWIDRSLGVGDYMQLRITNAYFANGGKLMLAGTVLVPALGEPFTVEIGPLESSQSPLVTGNIKQQLLAHALTEANRIYKNRSVDIGSLSLTISSFAAPNADQIVLNGKFKFHDLIEGTAQVILYPQLNVSKIDVDPATELSKVVFRNLLQIPIGGIHPPTIETRNPLTFSMLIDLSSSDFPFKFPENYALPTIRLIIPSSGDIQIDEPIAFKVIPGDFYIVPPYFVLTNTQFLLYPRSLWKFGVAGDLTLVNGTVSNVVHVAAHFEANLQDLDFKFDGPLYLAKTLQLAVLNGHINIPTLSAVATSKTTGLLRQLVVSDGNMRIDGKTCSFLDEMDMGLLGASLRGTLGIQINQSGCSSGGSLCPIRSGGLGAVCARGSVNLGPLGSANGSADFALDLSLPTIAAQVEHLPPFDIGVGVRASQNFAKASFSAFGFDFALITPSLGSLSPDLIRKMIEEALRPSLNLDALLNRKITLSLLPSSNGRDGDPQPSGGGEQGNGAEAIAPGPSNGAPVPVNAVTGRSLPGMAEPNTVSDKGNQSGDAAKGASQQNPWVSGDIKVTFELTRRIQIIICEYGPRLPASSVRTIGF